MRPAWLVVSLLVSSIVYLSANLLLGPHNERALAELQSHHDRLEANLKELRTRRDELSARVDLLRRSSDAIRLEARALQYYQNGEQVIRIDRYPVAQSTLSPGTVIRGRPVASDHAPTSRLLAALAGLSTLVLLFVTGRAEGDRRRAVQPATMRRASR